MYAFNMSKPQKLTSDFYINDSDESIEILIPAGETARVCASRRGDDNYERNGGDAGDSVVLTLAKASRLSEA
jgi:hypothetical protein